MWLKVTLLSLFCTNILAGTAASPLLPSIVDNFAGGEAFSHIFFVLPSLTSVPFILLSGILVEHFTKLKLVKLGLVLFIVAGIGCLVSYNPWMMLFFRAVLGVAFGLTMPFAVALISDYYYGETRGKMLSYAMIVIYSSAIMIILLTGFLITLHWRIVFLINLIALIPLFLLKKYMKPENKKMIKHHYPLFFSFIFKLKIYKLVLLNFTIIVLIFAYFTNITFFIISAKIGGAMEASIAQSLLMLCGILSNFLMHPIKRISSRILLALQVLFMAQALLMLSTYNISITEVYIASIILGIGYGSFYSAIIAEITVSSSRINKINAIAFVATSTSLAQFLSPLLFTKFNLIFNIQQSSTDFLFIGIGFICFAIYLFFKFLVEHKKIS